MCSKLSLPKPVQNKNRYKSQPVLRKQWKKASRESDAISGDHPSRAWCKGSTGCRVRMKQIEISFEPATVGRICLPQLVYKTPGVSSKDTTVF
jgi:hypothetical protein